MELNNDLKIYLYSSGRLLSASSALIYNIVIILYTVIKAQSIKRSTAEETLLAFSFSQKTQVYHH